MSIRIGIYGYGNLGRGVEAAITQNDDLTLSAVFTRRDPTSLKINTPGVPIYHVDKAVELTDSIDVMILCGGSANDLPTQTPELAKLYNVIDSFDTHAKIPEHFENVSKSATESGKIAIISIGWDPGMFSVNRLYAESILPNGKTYTFWGKGISQGHSNAIRRIDGVIDAKQYTIPIEDALQTVRNGETPEFTTRQKHLRECFVVVEDGADKESIEKQIKTMPNYFDEYDTTVTFVTQEELDREHSGLPHGGSVLRSGRTGNDLEFNNTIEYRLDLDSNPFFTGSILAAAARAAYRMNAEGQCGAKALFDVPPAYLSQHDRSELLAHML